MRILTLDNESYDLNTLPEEVDDMRFAIFDNSDPKDPDYHYIPLIFLESFSAPALVLRIGNNTIRLPSDWQILIGEPDVGDLEVLPLTAINDRGLMCTMKLPGTLPNLKTVRCCVCPCTMVQNLIAYTLSKILAGIVKW